MALLVCAVALIAIGGVRGGENISTLQKTPDSSYTQNLIAVTVLDPSVRASVEEAIKSRQYARAESLVLDQYNKTPDSPLLLVLLGRIFYLDGRYENCAEAMVKADKLRPLEDRDRFTLAMAYVAMNHGEGARPELNKLMQADPNKAVYPYWLSRLDYHDMKYQQAVANVQKAIQLDPNFMKAYDNLGLYEEGVGDYDAAIQAYRQAIHLNEVNGLHSPWPTHNLGALLTKLGRLDEAEPVLRESLKEDPRFAKTHLQLALLLEKQRKDNDAIQELKQAIALDPNYAEAYWVLSRIHRRQHNLKEAQEALEAFRKHKKD